MHEAPCNLVRVTEQPEYAIGISCARSTLYNMWYQWHMRNVVPDTSYPILSGMYISTIDL